MATRRPKPKEKDDKYVREPFVYPIGDQTITLPSLSWMKPGVVRKLRHLGEVDMMYTLFEMHLPPDELELLDDMEPDEFEKFTDMWREHSGVDLGES